MVRVQASCVQHPPSGEVLRAGGPTIGANSVSQHELFGWVSNPADTDGLLLSMRNKHPARPPRLTSAPPFAKKMMRAFFFWNVARFFFGKQIIKMHAPIRMQHQRVSITRTLTGALDVNHPAHPLVHPSTLISRRQQPETNETTTFFCFTCYFPPTAVKWTFVCLRISSAVCLCVIVITLNRSSFFLHAQPTTIRRRS